VFATLFNLDVTGTKGMSLIDDDVTLKIQAVADSTVESFAQISKR